MSKSSGSILIIDDDIDILTAGKLLLKRHYQHIVTCDNPVNVPSLMAKERFDAILLDMNFSPGESNGAQGFIWLERILNIDPSAVVVLITAHGGVNIAVDAMKKGATDFIAKPWQNEKMIATLSSAVKLRESRSEAATLKRANQGLAAAASVTSEPMLGKSAALKHVQTMIDRAAPTDANVLILGENGTGKELAARALHAKSRRSNKVFMAVDLGSISETLFESELFGHKRGAFTDAKEDRIGRLVAAEGGTLFLDEIGNLPLQLQAKLLTVLEQRRITPVGDQTPQKIDVRIVAATNISGNKLHDETHFRQDLLFRLNTVELHMPSLRHRMEDVPLLAEHFLQLYCRKYNKQGKTISIEAMQALQQYSWPGNIRALRHAVERAVILSADQVLSAKDFQLTPTPNQAGDIIPTPNLPPSVPLNYGGQNEDEDLNLERIERRTIAHALKRHRYNISHAAKELGLTRAALYRRMEKHGL